MATKIASTNNGPRRSCLCNRPKCLEITLLLEEHDPEYSGFVVVKNINRPENLALRAAIDWHLRPEDTSIKEYRVMKHHWPRELVIANNGMPHGWRGHIKSRYYTSPISAKEARQYYGQLEESDKFEKWFDRCLKANKNADESGVKTAAAISAEDERKARKRNVGKYVQVPSLSLNDAYAHATSFLSGRHKRAARRQKMSPTAAKATAVTDDGSSATTSDGSDTNANDGVEASRRLSTAQNLLSLASVPVVTEQTTPPGPLQNDESPAATTPPAPPRNDVTPATQPAQASAVGPGATTNVTAVGPAATTEGPDSVHPPAGPVIAAHPVAVNPVATGPAAAGSLVAVPLPGGHFALVLTTPAVVAGPPPPVDPDTDCPGIVPPVATIHAYLDKKYGELGATDFGRSRNVNLALLTLSKVHMDFTPIPINGGKKPRDPAILPCETFEGNDSSCRRYAIGTKLTKVRLCASCKELRRNQQKRESRKMNSTEDRCAANSKVNLRYLTKEELEARTANVKRRRLAEEKAKATAMAKAQIEQQQLQQQQLQHWG